MKKLIAILAALMFLFASSAVAETIYLKDMTTEELTDLFNRARNELLSRTKKVASNAVLVSDDELKIYFTGKGKDDSMFGEFELEIVIVNNSDVDLRISFDHIVINGWEVDNYAKFGPIGKGKKTKDHITLKYKEADLEEYKEMEDLEFSFHTYPDDSYHTRREYKNLIYNFNGQGWN